MTTNEFQWNTDAPLLEVEDLSIEYTTKEDSVKAVDELSFEIEGGDMFGLVGESGCGKSTVAQSILGLLPRNGKVVDGEIRLRGVDITALTTNELNDIRWKEISMISQGAMNSLNPVHRISTQIREAIQAHDDVGKKAARDRIADLFELVGLDPERMDEYPHQFSGGMKQRAFIAMALAHKPKLIIADEPTTALDVITQDQILKRIKELQEELNISILLITHDISVVAQACNRIGIMYAGKMMEYGNLQSVFDAPYNPYTLGLQNAFPSLTGEKEDLISIPGSPPDLSEIPDECHFVERCPFATEECREQHPPLETVGDDHYSACYHHDRIETMRKEANKPETWSQQDESNNPIKSSPPQQGDD
jgi:oligopeptide/dipeptide ABC transporter ATP-binding protein